MTRLATLLRLATLVTAAVACYALMSVSADLRRLVHDLDILGREVTTMAEDLASVADDVNTLAEDVNAIANSLGSEEESPEQVPLRSHGMQARTATRAAPRMTRSASSRPPIEATSLRQVAGRKVDVTVATQAPRE